VCKNLKKKLRRQRVKLYPPRRTKSANKYRKVVMFATNEKKKAVDIC
jgi:hypothetical protein